MRSLLLLASQGLRKSQAAASGIQLLQLPAAFVEVLVLVVPSSPLALLPQKHLAVPKTLLLAMLALRVNIFIDLDGGLVH